MTNDCIRFACEVCVEIVLDGYDLKGKEWGGGEGGMKLCPP